MKKGNINFIGSDGCSFPCSNTWRLSEISDLFRFLSQSYKFPSVLFGLRSAPRVFPTITSDLAAYLRKIAIQIFMYLYDWLPINSDKATLPSLISECVTTSPGYEVAGQSQKMTCIPCQHIEHILVWKRALQCKQSGFGVYWILCRVLEQQYNQPTGQIVHAANTKLCPLAMWRPNFHSLTHIMMIRPI